MSPRGWVIALLLLAAVGWWFSPVSPRDAYVPPMAQGARVQCPIPPRVVARDAPLQTPVPAHIAPVQLEAALLMPRAGFSIDARVLSTRLYRTGRESTLSPIDLALGWGPMRDDALLDQFEFEQSARFLSYGLERPPVGLTYDDITVSAANMHVIPADRTVANALKRLRPGDRVRVDGWLVDAESADGWRWPTSLTRADNGAGACELIYVCAVTRL